MSIGGWSAAFEVHSRRVSMLVRLKGRLLRSFLPEFFAIRRFFIRAIAVFRVPIYRKRCRYKYHAEE